METEQRPTRNCFSSEISWCAKYPHSSRRFQESNKNIVESGLVDFFNSNDIEPTLLLDASGYLAVLAINLSNDTVQKTYVDLDFLKVAHSRESIMNDNNRTNISE